MYRLVSIVSHPIRAIHPIRHVFQRPIDSGRCCTVQSPLLSSRPIKKAVLARQSVALPRGEPQQLPARQPSIATLRCKTVSEQVCHRLADALPAIKGKAVTASSRLFRSLRLLHNRQLAVLVYPPWPPKGKIIARERQCQRSRQCPESAYINIIPSGLCNKSARAPLVSASHTIRIMLSTLCQ